MFKIVDKKKFTIFVLSLLLPVGALSFMIFKVVQKVVQSKGNVISVQQKVTLEKKPENITSIATAPTKEGSGGLQNQIAAQTQPEYNNQQYAYVVAFPNTWYLNADSSETNLVSVNIEGKSINTGGQTFWSNYKNINDYSPEQKPEDFHLLGLTIYEVQGMNTDDLAAALGFDEESVLKKTLFEGKGISGMEYVMAGIDEKNPQVMIIFQKGLRFYVFNLAFINGDPRTAEIMEGIARTLSLK